jgi:hypothetical protein
MTYLLFSKGSRTSLCDDSEFNRTADVSYLPHTAFIAFLRPHFLPRLLPLIPSARGRLPFHH